MLQIAGWQQKGGRNEQTGPSSSGAPQEGQPSPSFLHTDAPGKYGAAL